ncbi:hypothetical protein Ciccas_011426 [Cichlidogyrus casuarinus]|uniref:Uncharacterized protein n=1 Tax=Cichlidogyrus casuarinus TaxID=1844966 RepID=A0ABD2PS35_9PLAT
MQHFNTKARVTLNEGRSSAFEITVNDRLVFSKLQIGYFPEVASLVSACQDVFEQKEQLSFIQREEEMCHIL